MKFRSSLFCLTAVLLVSAVGAVAAVGANGAGSKVAFRSLGPSKEVTAVASLPDGTIRFAQRDGLIVDVRPDGSKRKVVAKLKVRIDGQRGLVGLDTNKAGKTVLSWVRDDGRLVVGFLLWKGEPTVVFEGPMTVDAANGGHLLLEPDGIHVVMGLGDFLKGGKKGRFIRIDTKAKTSGELSVGWNNPFAFDWRDGAKAGGTIVVADNSPQDEPELVSELNGRKYGAFPAKTAPSAIAIVSGGTSPEGVVCGYWSTKLIRYRFAEGKVTALQTLANDCTIAVRLLPDRRLVYANESELMISTKPLS
jgi:hypothetical protein